MKQQFKRSYILRLFDKQDQLIEEFFQDSRNDFSGFDLSFEIKQLSYIINGQSIIRIYGLSDKTSARLVKSYRLELFAGYESGISLLYSGGVVNVFNKRQLPDSLTEIWAFDYIGNSVPQFRILDKSISQFEAFEQIAQEVPGLVVKRSNLIGVTDNPLGRTMSIDNLPYLQAFQKLGRFLSLNVHITNNILYTSLTNNRVNTDNPIYEINSNTGMIGSPTFDLASLGVQVRSNLNPLLVPGTQVRITSIAPEISVQNVTFSNYDQQKILRGTWTINYAIHYGSSRGDLWDTQLACYGFLDSDRVPDNE